ncbi:MAG: acyltransferase family protein [Microbacteriaceae bacterium]
MPASKTTSSTAATLSSQAAPSRLSGIDGLRAVAVVLVIVYHLSPGFLVGGFIGVDVFFVISGFLITGLLFREKARTGSIVLREFWRRRARRLLPALVAVVTVCSAVAFALSTVNGADILVGLGRQVLGAATFSYNWLSTTAGANYFDETTPELFRNLWSLAVEEQFYLLWPLIVLGLAALPRRRYSLPIVLALAIASAMSMAILYVPGSDPTRVYYGTDTHSFGLALGAALAMVSRDWPETAPEWSRARRGALQVAGAASLLAIVAFAVVVPADSPFAYQGGLVVVAILSTLAIAGLIVPGGVLGRILDVAPMRWVGERSYGLYLWHWPVFVVLVFAFPAAIMTYETSWMLGGAALLLTVLAATLSYTFLETPVRREGFRATARRAVSAWRAGGAASFGVAVTAAASLSLIALAGAAIAADPGAGIAQTRIEAGQALLETQSTPPPALNGGAAVVGDAEGSLNDPAPQELPSGEGILAIGDSVMLASAPELQEAFPGIAIDAIVSRQMRQAPDVLTSIAESGGLRPVLVLGLGTNGSISTDTVDTVLDIVGERTLVVLVNVQAPRGWTPGVNEALAEIARRERNVELANWESAIAPRIDLLARDRIHPGGPISGGIYADTVRGALQRLAELPPLLNPNDYGLSPRPS